MQQFSVKMYILIILYKYGGLSHCGCDQQKSGGQLFQQC